MPIRLRCLLFLAAACLPLYSQPASLAGFKDAGSFGVYVNEERVISITFKWQPDGAFENESVISMAGQKVTSTTTITPDKDGRWTKIVVQSPQGPATMIRDGDKAQRTVKEKTTT